MVLPVTVAPLAFEVPLMAPTVVTPSSANAATNDTPSLGSGVAAEVRAMQVSGARLMSGWYR